MLQIGSCRRGKIFYMTNQNSINKALQELEKVHPAGRDGFYYQGQEFKDMKCEEVSAFKGIDTIHKLYAVLRQAWKADTAYPTCQKEWVANDPSYGQCAITATLVYDMFGGSIHRIRVSGGGTHYFNKIAGHYIDLTREQFDLYDIPVAYEPNEDIPREYCGRNVNTKARYKQLQRNIINYLRQ
jgi:hypothetical protein